jgi:hypothetical protein
VLRDIYLFGHQCKKLCFLCVVSNREVKVYVFPIFALANVLSCLECCVHRSDTLLTIQNIVERVIRLGLRQLKRPQLPFDCQRFVRSPKQQRTIRIRFVDTVDQEGDAVWFPHESTLKRRNTDLTALYLLDDLANGQRFHVEISSCWLVYPRMGTGSDVDAVFIQL